MDQFLITKRLVLGGILGCSPWLSHAIFENKLNDTERTRSYRVITDGFSVIYFGRNTLLLSDSWMLYLGLIATVHRLLVQHSHQRWNIFKLKTAVTCVIIVIRSIMVFKLEHTYCFPLFYLPHFLCFLLQSLVTSIHSFSVLLAPLLSSPLSLSIPLSLL